MAAEKHTTVGRWKMRGRSGGRLPKSFFVCVPLIAALALVLFTSGRAKAAHGPQLRQPTVARGSSPVSFAIADFDGDHHPDFASVQAAEGSASAGGYWVRFRLSESGRRYVRVAAPGGGLSIEARDVNGDHAPDLVVATAWLDKTVAILLNDGHGNFSQVDPGRFPHAFSRSSKDWNASSAVEMCAVAWQRESSDLEFPAARGAEELQDSGKSLCSGNDLSARSRTLVLHAGRAPPATTLL